MATELDSSAIFEAYETEKKKREEEKKKIPCFTPSEKEALLYISIFVFGVFFAFYAGIFLGFLKPSPSGHIEFQFVQDHYKHYSENVTLAGEFRCRLSASRIGDVFVAHNLMDCTRLK